jgi:hypothetical protein
MTKIISWDVGVKNLAFCYMEEDKGNKKKPFTIHKWKTINLMKDSTEICGIKSCEKLAAWFYETDDETKYYCTKHKHITGVLIPSKKTHIKKNKCDVVFKIKNKSCDSKIKLSICNKNGDYKHYCGKHKPKDICTLNSLKKANASKISIVTMQQKLLEILDDMPSLLKADAVVIENQPSFKNPRMKSISSTLFNFFLMRSTIDKDIVDTNIKHVVFMSPSNKLKLDEKSSQILANTPKKKKYKVTKDLSIKYCRELLKHDKKNLEILASAKKQDDLCDSFLQGCYYLKKKL